MGLRKIKRIGFKVFLGLKELFKDFKPRHFEKKTRHYHKRKTAYHKPESTQQPFAQSYEPTDMACAYDSLFWQWRRVIQWDRYINDPHEQIKGHMITMIC